MSIARFQVPCACTALVSILAVAGPALAEAPAPVTSQLAANQLASRDPGEPVTIGTISESDAAATGDDRNRDAKLDHIETQLQSLLKEVRALRGGSSSAATSQILLKVLVVRVEDDAAGLLSIAPGTGPRKGASETAGSSTRARLIRPIAEGLTERLHHLARNGSLEVLSRPYLLLNDGQEGDLSLDKAVDYVDGYLHKDPADPKSESKPHIAHRPTGLHLMLTARRTAAADEGNIADKPGRENGGQIRLDVNSSLTRLLGAEVSSAPDPAGGEAREVLKPITGQTDVNTGITVRTGETVEILFPARGQSNDHGDPPAPVGGKSVVVFVTPHLAAEAKTAPSAGTGMSR